MNIYLDSFPENERQSLSLVKKRIEDGKSLLFVGITADEVVAMALVWEFKQLDFVLLDYMAVKSKYRNFKIGSQFLANLKNRLGEKNKTIVLEVEHPNFGDNKTDRVKRIEFYLRNGALIIDDFIYLLPPLDNTTPTEMVLMVIPVQKTRRYKKSEIHELVTALYKELYLRKDSDSLLNSFIHKIPETITLSTYIKNDNH